MHQEPGNTTDTITPVTVPDAMTPDVGVVPGQMPPDPNTSQTLPPPLQEPMPSVTNGTVSAPPIQEGVSTPGDNGSTTDNGNGTPGTSVPPQSETGEATGSPGTYVTPQSETREDTGSPETSVQPQSETGVDNRGDSQPPQTETAPETEKPSSVPDGEQEPPGPSPEADNNAITPQEEPTPQSEVETPKDEGREPDAEGSESPKDEKDSEPASEPESPEEEGPAPEQEPEVITANVFSAVEESNVTEVALVLESTDDVEALAEGFTFAPDRREELLVKTPERVDDGDVVTLKSISTALLASPSSAEKFASVLVLSVYPDGELQLVQISS